MESQDKVGVTTVWTVRKYTEQDSSWAFSVLGREPSDEDFAHLGIAPYEIGVVDGNLATTAGLTRLTALLNAGGGNAMTSTTVRVGAGDGAGTAAIGDTDLSAAAGSTHRWFQTCTVSVSVAVLTAVAIFASGDGNFAWNEFGLDIGTATVTSGNTVNAVLFNHKTSIAQGTKASGQVWTATATITFS
jgi:hypothetical protein